MLATGKFRMPMSTPVLIRERREGEPRVIAHALDFDIVCEAPALDVALQKLSLAVKKYIEFGLGNNWTEDILFPAPIECWHQFAHAKPSGISVPIQIDDKPVLLCQALLNEPQGSHCPAYGD